MHHFCFGLVWQLTAEDETFLTENATATLSQFEKVTPNLGENKDPISPQCLTIQFSGWSFSFVCGLLPSGSEDKIMALASSGVKTKA